MIWRATNWDKEEAKERGNRPNRQPYQNNQKFAPKNEGDNQKFKPKDSGKQSYAPKTEYKPKKEETNAAHSK